MMSPEWCGLVTSPPDDSDVPHLEGCQIRGEFPEHLLIFYRLKKEGRRKEGGII